MPISIIKSADNSMDDSGNPVKLNRWITCCTSGRNKNKIPRTMSAAPLNQIKYKQEKYNRINQQ